MRRRRVAAWLMSLPLMAVGSETAHVLAYRWVYPDAHVRLRALLATGHAYLGAPSFVPMALGAVFALEAVGLGWTLAGAVRRGRSRPVPAGAFALLPILGFTVQELSERWLLSGSFPWWTFLQPTFRIGLALQLPIALLAWLLARVLLRVAIAAGRTLRASAPLAPAGSANPVRVLAARCAPAPRDVVGVARVRGPPGRRPAVAP